jgi:hypothetical protein|tara:strand:+ start:54 stop:377 length:324 start_codon:yes stop_codon:yes gene_type:complete
MGMNKILGVIAWSILLSGCISQVDEDHPLIGYLKTNEHTISLHMGPRESLYTVRTHEGRVIAANISASELITRLPHLRTLVERGMADDASLDPAHTRVAPGFIDTIH